MVKGAQRLAGWLGLVLLGGLLTACGGGSQEVAPLTTTTPEPTGMATATPVPPTPVVTLPPQATPTNAVPSPLPTQADVKPPRQPEKGPGSTEKAYSRVTMHNYGAGEQAYYIFEPASPAPAKPLPVVALLHGYAGVDVRDYRAWIDHIVERGNIVIFPLYQVWDSRDGTAYTANAAQAIKAALDQLKKGDHVRPDLGQFSLVGYSAGGVIATNLAARAETLGLPVPKALFGMTPGGCANCSLLSVRNFTLAGSAELAKISPDTKLLLLAGDRDIVVGRSATDLIWAGTSQIPSANKNYLLANTDAHGSPVLVADHGMATHKPPDAFDFNGAWKLFDGLESCALNNKFCDFALGGTTQQLSLGVWSDGTPVTPLKVLG